MYTIRKEGNLRIAVEGNKGEEFILIYRNSFFNNKSKVVHKAKLTADNYEKAFYLYTHLLTIQKGIEKSNRMYLLLMLITLIIAFFDFIKNI